MDTQALVTFN